jgi:hypothetical protein
MKLSKSSLALLLIQLAIVSSIAAKYLYQRWSCQRVWARAAAIDPEMPMRGRYLSLRLTVDGCQSTLPSASAARFPRDVNGAVIRGPYRVRASAIFRAYLKVEDNHLMAFALNDDQDGTMGQEVSVVPGAACEAMRLDAPVDFYLSEHAQNPLPLRQGQELWIEVTVPPKGPPRPTQLALKEDGAWKPLGFQ